MSPSSTTHSSPSRQGPSQQGCDQKTTDSKLRSAAPPSRAATLGVQATAWRPASAEMDRRDWVIAGRRLGNIGRCNQWWIGDWIRYGTARWGERYSEAARITGYDPRSLANMASVAASFPPSRRRDNLTWSHHSAVASLPDGEQEKWLDFATTARLSVADLRIEIKSRQRATSRDAEEKAARHHIAVICPHCKNEISLDSRGLNKKIVRVRGHSQEDAGKDKAIPLLSATL